ncbi:MAG TPA: sugar ABC transporter ATP-binding protein [Vicinamibacterales bacterium]|jgi:ribose transport system ATP-binding protein|nr:sugar ABC transporter ATP-binding protein [Vicinamibacterales bacterium]
MDAPVLDLRGIEKRFPGVHALKGVDLTVHAGEVLALLGENGAGKSTLMKIVGGVERPDAGDVRVAGEPVVIRDVQAAAALGIAFIHQELNLLDNLDVAGNVLLGREPTYGGPLRLVDRARMRAIVRPLLEELGLRMTPSTPVAGLSIAQQQLVEIAKALSIDARVIIMDEPTSSLTPAETTRLHAVVAELRRRGTAVIYITHRLGEVEAIADRAVVLRDGANAGALAKDELTHDRMIRLMVGRDLEAAAPAAEPAAGAPRLRVAGLRTTRYPQHAVSFTVGRGEILGVAGLIGAGRSEVARAIFGIDPPVGGTVEIDGAAVALNDPVDAIRAGVCLVPEDRRLEGLIVDFTIRENVSLPGLERQARYGLVSGGGERETAEAMSRRLRVKAPSIDVAAATLSGGNQQKVVLAKWLALEPRVLIVDEPTRGIDVGAKAEIYALLRELAAAGVAIVMISSDMEEILRVSDRVAVMHEGRLEGILAGAERTEPNIMTLAVGRPLPDAPAASAAPPE